MNQEELRKWKEIMMKDKISTSEFDRLEKLVAAGRLDLTDFQDLNDFATQLDHDLIMNPTPQLDQKFYTMLGEQKVKLARKNRWKNWYFTLPAPLQWAVPIIMLLVGFGLGWWSSPTSNQAQSVAVASINPTEKLMISLLNEGSTSDRLEAVNITKELDQISKRVSNILLFTLNHDDSDNVRMACIDALVNYADSPMVRKGLVESIRHQTSPLVILSLSEALYAIGETSTLDDLPSLFHEELPAKARKDLESSMQIIM